MTSLLADLRGALRAARHRPAFTALAVATIALGIGSTTAVFSVVRTVLLEPLPYRDAGGIVTLHTSGLAANGIGDWLSGPEILDMRTVAGLEEVAAYNMGVTLNLTGDGEPERLMGAGVTANAFQMLGADAAIGRTFTAEESSPGGPDAILLSHGLWRRRFASDAAIVGSQIQINGASRTVVGVMQPGFALPAEMRGRPSDAWVPLRLTAAQPGSRGNHSFYGIGRLRPGVTLAALTAELAALSARLTAEGQYSPESRFTLLPQPARDYVVGSARPVLMVLLTAVGLVLLIACVNVANLLVERSEGRRREFAVRAALGAGRGHLLRQLLSEQVVVAALGGAAGLALAAAGVRTMAALAPVNVPRIREAGLDGTVLLFTLGLTALCAVLFGLAPLLHASRLDLHSALAAGASRATMGRGQQRMRRFLVASELALAIVLLAGAGLALRTFSSLLNVDPGFDPRGVLTMRVVTPATSYPDAALVEQFYQEALERVRALPGVEVAGAVRVLPLAAEMGDWTIEIEGRAPPQGQDFDGDWQVIAPGYFEAMRVRLVSGRLPTDADHFDAPPIAVINETMAREYWPEGDAIGKRWRINGQDAPWIEIVGIVADERHASLDGAVNRRWFRPHAQWTQSLGGPVRGMTLVVRTAGDPLALAAPVREIIRALDPNLPVAEVRTLESVVAASVARQRFTMLLLGVFAATALVLAAVGVYGVMSYWVTERTGEIGVRMALGATRNQVMGLVVSQALRPAVAGIAVGTLGALALTRLMRGMLFGVAPHDPVTFATAPLVLLAVGLLASWVPALRASAQDPVRALREE